MRILNFKTIENEEKHVHRGTILYIGKVICKVLYQYISAFICVE